MRTPFTAVLAALALLPLLATEGCGSSSQADDLFGNAPAAQTGGAGGSSADASTGGSGGTSNTGGTGQTGGYGGTTPAGGSGGTDQTGGYAGTPSGGNGGTGQTGGNGGTGGPPTGGMGGAPTGGTGGGAPQLGEVPCPTPNPSDSDSCLVPGQICCLGFADTEDGACINGNQAATCETDIQCDAPSDCPPNTVCCGHLVGWNGTWRYDGVRCQPSCNGPDDVVFCDPYDNTDSCDVGEYCDASQILPDGYYVCQ